MLELHKLEPSGEEKVSVGVGRLNVRDHQRTVLGERGSVRRQAARRMWKQLLAICDHSRHTQLETAAFL